MSLVRIDALEMQNIAEHLYDKIELLRNSPDNIEGIWTCVKSTNANIQDMSTLRKRMTYNESGDSIPKGCFDKVDALKVIVDALVAVTQRGFNADAKACSLISGDNQYNITYVDTTPVSFPNQYGDGFGNSTEFTNNQTKTPVYDPNNLLKVYQQMFGDDAYNVITQALTNGTALTPELTNTLEYLQSQFATQSATVNEMQASANNNGEQGGYIDNYNNYVNTNGYSNNNSTTFYDPAYSIGGGYLEMLEQLEQEANRIQNQGMGYPTYQDNYTATVEGSDAASGYIDNGVELTFGNNDNGFHDPYIDYFGDRGNNDNTFHDPYFDYYGDHGNQNNNFNDPYFDYFGDHGNQNNNNNGFNDPYFDYYGDHGNQNNNNNGFNDPYYDYFGNQPNNTGFNDPYFDYYGGNNSNEQTLNFQDPYNSYYNTQGPYNSFQNYYNNQAPSNGFQDPYYSYYNIPEPSPFFNEFQQAWDMNVQNNTAMFNDPGAAYFNWQYGTNFHI